MLLSLFEDGDDAVFSGDVAGNDGDDVVGNLESGQVDDFGAEMGGLGLGDVRRAMTLLASSKSTTPTPGSLGLGALGRHLLGGHETEVHQYIYQIIVFFSHGSFFRPSAILRGKFFLRVVVSRRFCQSSCVTIKIRLFGAGMKAAFIKQTAAPPR